MKILICLDNSSVTEKILAFSKKLASELKSPEITVLHIIDETLFFSTTGVEVALGETLAAESNELKKMCEKYLGKKASYMEVYGMPRLKIEEMLVQVEHDMLVVGSYGRHGLAGRLLGGFAQHVLGVSKKPVIFIP
jgi:nucleotide-binding universal stress UspA family protein